MKSIILACTPAECEKIVNGDMSILVRKVVPKETPFKVYVYCGKTRSENVLLIDKETKEAGFGDYRNGCCCDIDGYVDCFIADDNVIGDFVCNKVGKYETHVILCAYYEVNGAYVEEKLRYNKGTCLSYEDMVKKSNGKPLYGVHISDLKIYDEPKELNEFKSQDKMAIKTCKYRVRAGQPEYVTKHGGWLNGTFACEKECDYITWCRNCLTKQITRPPKNYIYVEE